MMSSKVNVDSADSPISSQHQLPHGPEEFQKICKGHVSSKESSSISSNKIIIDGEKSKNQVPDEVLVEVAKAELARSNQWLVGTLFAGIPSCAMIVGFGFSAANNPKMEFFFWVGSVLAIFVLMSGPYCSHYIKKRAIKTLCEIHSRRSTVQSHSTDKP